MRDDATYLVTGGLGGLGLQVAAWLSDQGARHLVLLGRSAPNTEARAALAELTRAGVEVWVVQGDVAALLDLKAVVPSGAPPLRGVVHAAGALADGVFVQQEWDRFAEALRPKVDGAWRLHVLTADQPLDFFVLFSSAAAVLGSAGQSGYGAANAFLDALAAHRRLHGRPALSVNWGPWAGPGMVTRLEAQTDRTPFPGMGRLEPERALALLGELLDQGAGPQVVALPVRWPAFLQAHPEARGLPLLEAVLPAPEALGPATATSAGPRRTDLIAGTAEGQQAGLEAYLLEVLARVLNCAVTDLDAATPIERFGLDSLMQVELANHLRQDLGLGLPTSLALESTTVRDLAAILAESLARGGEPGEVSPVPSDGALVAELEADIRLDPEVRAVSLPPAPAPATEVLLTGATGFVGAYLLEELLRQTRARVWCLARADSAATAHRRVMENLAAYGLQADPDRVVGVAGDLEVPGLGLEPGIHAELAKQVAEIWHAGARVSFLQPYRELAAANVFSVTEVLRLATRTVLKPVHFVSTLGMLTSAWRDPAAVVAEEGPVAHGAGLPNGYEQSKWVAEAVLHLARERGVPVTIYRPGLLTGDSRTGEYRNTRDFVSRMLKGCIELGIMPALDNLLELAPVDFAARAMVAIAASPEHRGRTFHVNHPEPATAGELAAWLGEAGYRVELVPFIEWKERLFSRVAAGDTTALGPYLDFLRPLSEAQAALPALDSRQARQALAAAGIHCPSAAELMRAYLGYFVRTGFLPSP
ncbi:MAG: thioester reductase domain-containing protein [Candidatus Latescibacterota bacterium]